MGDFEGVNSEVCAARRELLASRISTCEEEVHGMRDDLKEVRDLQKQILYAIIGLFGASVLTLIGVLAGRAIDFKVFFP
jgi:hypothetical protein